MNVFISKRNIQLEILIFFLLAFGNFFHIFSDESSIAGVFVSDIFLVLFLLWCLLQSIKLYSIKVKYLFLPFILILILGVFISSFQTLFLTGQPYLLGIRPQREFLILLISYFPIRKIFAYYNIHIAKLWNRFIFWAVTSAFFYFFAKYIYLANGTEFLGSAVHYSGTFSPYRIYIESSLIDIAIIISAFYYINTLKLKYLFPLIVGFLSQIWISQGRLELISISASIIFYLFLSKKTFSKKMFLWGVFLLVLYFFIQSSMFDNIWGTITGESKVNNTLEIRHLGKSLYINQLLDDPFVFFFGTGYPSMLYTPAFEKTGFFDDVFLSDNGIVSFVYIYGLWGGIGVLGLFLTFFLKSIYLSKVANNHIFLMYIIMISIMAINIIFWYWHPDAMLILILMMCSLEHLLYDKNTEQVEISYE